MPLVRRIGRRPCRERAKEAALFDWDEFRLGRRRLPPMACNRTAGKGQRGIADASTGEMDQLGRNTRVPATTIFDISMRPPPP